MIKWNEVTWYSKLLAIIFFIGVLPALCFYVGKEYGEVMSSPIESRYVPEIEKDAYKLATSSVSNIDTSGWKTYRNEEYGFEIKYPSNFEQDASDNLISTTSQEFTFTEIVPSDYFEGGGDGSPPMVVLVVTPVKNMSWRDVLADSHYSFDPKLIRDNPPVIDRIEGTKKIEFEFETNFTQPHGYSFQTENYQITMFSWHGLLSEDNAVLGAMIRTFTTI